MALLECDSLNKWIICHCCLLKLKSFSQFCCYFHHLHILSPWWWEPIWLTDSVFGKTWRLQGHTRSKEQFWCPKLQSKIHCAWTCSHLLENPFWVPIGMMLHVSKQPWSVFWRSEMLTRCLTPHARASGGTVSWDAQVHLSSCNSQHQGGKKASTNYTRPPQGLTPFARSPSSSSNKLQSAFDLIPIPFNAS